MAFSGEPVVHRSGLWQPSSRPNLHQGIDYATTGDYRALLWYTYGENGQPVWYLAAGPEPAGKLAFVFPGQGSQYLNMGRDLVCTFPQAMQILQRANRKFDDGALLSDLIFPPADYTGQDRRRQQAALQNTAVAQPAIGAVSLAMLKVLQSFGVNPDATCGHSFGELTALCAAGWIDEDTLLELAIKRGRLMADAGGNQDQSAGLCQKPQIKQWSCL